VRNALNIQQIVAFPFSLRRDTAALSALGHSR
jgi:hypothetical protein